MHQCRERVLKPSGTKPPSLGAASGARCDAPRPIDEGVPIEHVRFWRTGGYDFGSDAYVEGTGELKPPPKVEGGAW